MSFPISSTPPPLYNQYTPREGGGAFSPNLALGQGISSIQLPRRLARETNFRGKRKASQQSYLVPFLRYYE